MNGEVVITNNTFYVVTSALKLNQNQKAAKDIVICLLVMLSKCIS